ncbi:MAG: BatD family protein [Cocleimonas sp.]|nr:BatD family protein [Cocleimonas sp.]
MTLFLGGLASLREIVTFFFFLFLLCFPLISAADLSLSIDRAELSIDEAFELSISSNSAASGKIDIGSLQQDFEILDTYKQSSLRIINGTMAQATVWTYTLVAKRAGKIMIPVITVGNDATKAREIIVKKDATQSNGNQDVMVEAEVEQKSAYVQGQFIYIQRLLYARSFRSDSTLTRPRLKSGRAEIESLGNNPVRKVKRNGRDYLMLTRRFAIIPQESGKLEFAPSLFSGTMRRSSQRLPNNSFSFSSRAKRVRVRSNEVSIEIKPRATEFTGKHWIVAKNFSLHLNWPTPPDQIEAGKPVSVILAAIADGLRAEQLPEINLQSSAGIKLYPEKPTLTNERNLDGIIGTMNKQIILVSTGGGEFEIPALSIPWWNSKTNKQEIATLDAIKLTISGAPIPIGTQKAISKPELDKALIKDEVLEKEKPFLSNTLMIIIALVGGLLVTLLAMLFLRGKEKKHTNISSEKHTLVNKQQILTLLEQACSNNNAPEAQQRLQQWMQSIGKSPTAFSASANTVLQQQIEQLNHVLYAKEKGNWQGWKLWQAVESYQVQSAVIEKGDRNQQGLEPLYY